MAAYMAIHLAQFSGGVTAARSLCLIAITFRNPAPFLNGEPLMNLSDWIRLLILSLVWGSSFILIEISLRGAGPFTIVFIRIFIAALLLHLYCGFQKCSIRPNRTQLAAFVIMGIIASVIPFLLIAYGQIGTDSGLAAILIAPTPLFTVTIAYLWGRSETITPAKIAGVMAGILGVAVLMGPDALAGLQGGQLGKYAILLAAFFYAFSAVYGRRFREFPPAAVAAWMLTMATIAMAPLAMIFEQPLSQAIPPGPLAAMIAVATFSTAFAYILYFTILANAGATNAMLVTFVQPPLAIMLGIVFLGESLEWHQLGGLAIILTGLAFVDGRIIKLAGTRMRRVKDAA